MAYKFTQFVIATWILQHSFAAALGQQIMPQQTILDQAEDLYARGKFEESFASADLSIQDENKLTDTDKARLYLLRARLDLVFKKNISAREWLEKLHRLQPNTKLDPIKDPPEAITIWAEIKQAPEPEPERKIIDVPAPTRPAPTSVPALKDPPPPKPPFRFTGRWLRYGLFAVPAGVAAFSKHDDARYAAMGFLAGAISITLWEKTFATPSAAQTARLSGLALPNSGTGVALTWIN